MPGTARLSVALRVPGMQWGRRIADTSFCLWASGGEAARQPLRRDARWTRGKLRALRATEQAGANPDPSPGFIRAVRRHSGGPPVAPSFAVDCALTLSTTVPREPHWPSPFPPDAPQSLSNP